MKKNLTLGERIEDLMKKKGVTNAQLAEAIGTKPGNLSKIRNGENTNPKSELIKNLALYFDVSTDYILGLSDYTSTEHSNIGKITGLSEKNIELLKERKKLADERPNSAKFYRISNECEWIQLMNDCINILFEGKIIDNLLMIERTMEGFWYLYKTLDEPNTDLGEIIKDMQSCLIDENFDKKCLGNISNDEAENKEVIKNTIKLFSLDESVQMLLFDVNDEFQNRVKEVSQYNNFKLLYRNVMNEFCNLTFIKAE